MFRRFSANFALFSIALDMLLISLALLAAALFGVSTPQLQQFGAGLRAFSTAALRYAAAAAVGLLSRQRIDRKARLQHRSHHHLRHLHRHQTSFLQVFYRPLRHL